jgi:hypothetical protein
MDLIEKDTKEVIKTVIYIFFKLYDLPESQLITIVNSVIYQNLT